MPTLQLHIYSEAGYNQYRLNNKTLLEVHHAYDQTFQVDLPESKLYTLTYFIHGNPGDHYWAEVLSPIVIPKHERTLGAGGETFGYIEIDLTSAHQPIL